MSDDTTRGPGQNGAEQPASGSVPPPPAPPAYDPSAHDVSASSTDADAQRAYGEPPAAPASGAPSYGDAYGDQPTAPYGDAYGTPPQAPAGYGAPTSSAPSYAPPTGPAYGQGGYAQQPSGYPAAAPYGAAQGYPASYTPYPTEPKTNVLAIVSLIASIVGFIWIIPFLGGLAGAIMGHISLGQIKKNGEKGRGLALAGIIVGWVGVGLFVIGVIAFFALIAAGASSGSRYSA
ncbi:hypothetical protein CVS47_01259 [Microbacterium lemovicicum]|uniref:DUF4190 domain-containing protein n=1 Tax=Microbacterium lemovicicum TaxID=1072463 RepID=A0A3Q9IZG5_9MICO|nr:DUF4190 domain-containing protein [Microbacterium lemovicicum]AZS36652.1 hypothetical protein CVS47_01259 [Microbacterium lemovicicum]